MGTASSAEISTTERVPSSSSASSRHFSDRTFQSAPISRESKKAIKHEFMSDVQAATIDLGLAGKDLLVQAKTGTGKTIAFLLPAIERLAKAKQPLNGISVLVLAPTRELALQIEQEAVMLLQHHKNMTVGHVIGGTNARQSVKTILNKPTILIATPGRLHDHLTSLEHADAVRAQFRGLKTLVFDEADRLLDQGFKKELDGIISALPNRQVSPRQVMLFSATISKEIREISRKALSKDHEFVSTLLEDEANTHEHVPQSYIITPFADSFPNLLHILRQDRLTHAAPDAPSQLSCTPPYKPGKMPNDAKPLSKSKVIVFFPTARQVSVAYELLSALPGLPPVFQIHSRNSQGARTRASADFSKAGEAILLSSDVAARGMDFPGVTMVIQVGLPSSSEQYIHRLGRTARAGESGQGIIILDPAEKPFLSTKEMRALPIHPAPSSSSSAEINLSSEQTEIAAALSGAVSPETKAQAYRAWLGYYKTHLRIVGWSTQELVKRANGYVRNALGWEEEDVPSIEPKTVGKMQLRGVPGLNVAIKRKVEDAE